MLNLSPLFFTTLDDESCMHDELDLTPEQRAWIASARTDVRDCLRTGIPRVLRASGYTEDVPQPRFFTQGSWAYKTLNSPAQRPQQADVDDGCYPLWFITDNEDRTTEKLKSLGYQSYEATVLHYVVKHILREAGELRTPEDVVYVEAESEKRCHSRTWRLPEQHLALSEVELEKRLGLTRPDLVCKAIDTAGDYSYPSLCIEVTVSNTISQERRNRIREVGLPALEIDLSALQGRITRDRLKYLVVRSTYVKKWLYNPVLEQQSRDLEKEVKALAAAEDEALEEERAEMRRVNALPLQEVAEQYLEKAYRYFLLLQDTGDSWPAAGSTTGMAIAEAREDLSKQANLLAWKGYPGADEEDFLHPRGVLEALLSLKSDRGLTRKLNTGFQVLNALVTGGKGIANELTPLYLAAAKAFDVPMTLAQQAIVEQWRGEVIERIRTIKGSYVRSSVYDPLLGTLFPELREAFLT